LAESAHDAGPIAFPRLSFHVPLDPARLLRVRERVRDYLRMHCASLDDIDDVILCVEEACANAIQHSGSPEDLEIEMAFEGDRLSVRITDHGCGFDVDSFDPRREPDITALGGRGLYVIAKVMDELELACCGGTTVVMRRKVEVPSSAQRRAVFVQEAGPATIPAVVDGEQRLFAMLEDLADGFVALDWEWRIVYANPTAAALLRMPAERLIGGMMYELFPEMRDSEFGEHGRLAMEQGVASHFESYFAPHGTWYELRVYPTVSGVSIYFNEINRRKQIERERDELLRKAEDERAQLQTVLDVLPVAVGITDAEGRVVAVNPTADRLWRGSAPLPRSPAEYGTYRAWWPESGEPLGPEDWTTARVLRYGEPILGELIEIERFDGTRGVVISSSVPIRDSTGTVAGAVGVTEDITHHHRARRLTEALNDVDALIHSTLSMDEIMRRLVGEATLALDVDAAAIELREDDMWPVRFAKNLPPDVIGRPLTKDSVVSRTVARTGRRLVVPDTATSSLFQSAEVEPFRSLVAVPLRVRGDTFGVLVFLDSRIDAFDEPAIDFADKLSASVSLALENARLFEAMLKAETLVAEQLQLTGDLLTATRSLTSTLELPSLLNVLVDTLTRLTGRPRVFINAVDLERGELTALVSVGGRVTPPGTVMPLAEISALAQAAILEGHTRVLDWDAEEDSRRRGERYAARLVLFVPLLVGERSIGHICVDSPGERVPFSRREIAAVEGIAAQAAMALENARLYGDVASRERLGSALNDLSADIASVLDSDAILHEAVASVAGALEADSALVYRLDEDEWVPGVAWGMPVELRDTAWPRETMPFAELSIETRHGLCIDDCEADDRVDAALRRAWGARSIGVAPLIVRGAVAAALFLTYHRDVHRFTAPERTFIDQAAVAVSGALERAHVYEREHGIATTLQNALLALPERIPGLLFAHRYHSATEVALVGGDFYDVFELDNGLLGVTVGDMSGKGLDAAVMTSLVKHTVRAHAVEKGKTPADIVRMASRVLFMQSHLEHFATVFFAILDRRDGRLVYCNAGHPAPAILRRARELTELPSNSPLIGAFPDMPFGNSETYVETGDVLLLYTDGLVEARRGEALFGESRLAALLERSYGLEPEQLVESVAHAVYEFAEGRLSDDLALLALRRLDLPGPTQQKLRLPTL
jgi:serine phosphatase RsbU (regulator of sigma subunit)/anti-sigma regulatory factor (Ser/Thr protein kinase)